MSVLSHPQASLGTRDIAAKGTIGDLACFAIPALAFLHVWAGGVLYATDLCLLAAFPFVVHGHRKWLLQIKPIRMFLYLGLLWLAAQILTDVVRHSPFEDYSRGWSKILLTLTHFVTIALLIRQSRRRLILYGAGLAVGGMLTFFIAPGELAADYPWKFGVSLPITILVCLIAGKLARQSRTAAVAMLAVIALVNLFLGFRSLGAVCAISAIYSYFQLSPRLGEKRRRLQTVWTVAVLAAGVSVISAIYAYGAQGGWFGGDAEDKYELQSSGAAGILVGGRTAFFGAFFAIADSPLLGHGSWAKDPKYAAILYASLAELGYQNLDIAFESEEGLIPSHSYLLGAWVESGIVGAMFWFWVLWFTASTLLRASGRETLIPFFAFVGMLLAWNVLFSPYGADARFTATYFVYAMILFALHSQTQKRKHAYAQGLHRNHLV